MSITKTQLGLVLALLISNALILFGSSTIWEGPRLIAAVAMTFALSGWAWLPLFGWLWTTQLIERIVLVIGLSSLLSALALFLTLFLPGPFTEMSVMICLNLTIFVGLMGQLVIGARRQHQTTNDPIEWQPRRVWLILLAILAVALLTRLFHLGYAEFHEDALENMRLIVRAYKGEEYAPFLDSKGPIHWLLPAALWYLNGWVNEGIARLPFAITSLTLIPLMYALGKRMSGRDSVGLVAAGFVALNGFYVAYARHVENQSLIVFWGALAMWFAYRYYQERINHLLIFVAFALAIGLIAHPDVLLYLPVFGYIIAITLWQHPDRRAQLPWLIGGAVLFGSLSALFYIPYFFDPQIGLIYQYFAADRIGESLLYNRVENLFDQDALYSSRYHAPLLVLLLFWLLLRHFAQWAWRGWLIVGSLIGAIVTTVLWPDLWVVRQINLAFAPYALLTLIFIALPRTTFETKTLFLWFITPLGALLFLAKDAADHIQVAYTGWALLSALALVDMWGFLHRPTQQASVVPTSAQSRAFGFIDSPPSFPWTQSAKWALVLVLVGVAGLILFYQYLVFLNPVTRYWEVKRVSANQPDSVYNYLYGSIPRPRKIFSNPRLSGWKTVGYLWATGKLSGDFRSINESFAVPIWYTFQTPRSCYEDPQHYWVRRSWDGWPKEEQEIIAQGYVLTHIVRVDRDPKLHLYLKNGESIEPEILDVDDYRRQFDRLATPARFAREESGQQKTTFNFGGDRLRLIGYDLPQAAQPGITLPVTVYWETLAPMETRYRAFMHLIDEQGGLWGQHDDDPACRLLTTEMRPGQRSTRQFRIPVDPATPPGQYTVRFGLYDPDTLERLDIWDAQTEQPAGDSLILGMIQID